MAYKGKGKSGQKPKKEKPEFDQQIVDLARVTRVTKGGKQLSFRATVVIGDRKGRVGYGVDKGKDVQMAVEKAVNQAKKNIITVPMNADSIPHTVQAKYKAAKVFIKPAPKGSGIIAGGSIRVVLELAGVPNASAKMIGRTNNKISNVKATFDCLQMFKKNSLPKKVEPVAVKLDTNISNVNVDEGKKEVVKKVNKDNDKQ
ncbi:MAG TPA: 30S ribosomal protein S5 [Candidatus Magasanikbacteria bacterium]|nr:30S ribosomal protein S5 [Candidatus Magasanikbacteria bacterium]